MTSSFWDWNRLVVIYCTSKLLISSVLLNLDENTSLSFWSFSAVTDFYGSGLLSINLAIFVGNLSVLEMVLQKCKRIVVIIMIIYMFNCFIKLINIVYQLLQK